MQEHEEQFFADLVAQNSVQLAHTHTKDITYLTPDLFNRLLLMTRKHLFTQGILKRVLQRVYFGSLYAKEVRKHMERRNIWSDEEEEEDDRIAKQIAELNALRDNLIDTITQQEQESRASTEPEPVLTEIYLNSSGIRTIPENLCTLTSVRTLNLASNRKLKTLPTCIDQLVNLEHLKLDACQDFILPDSIGQLPNLRELSLYGCFFPSFPEQIFNLSNLDQLNLRYNEISSLPKDIGKLRKLRRLNLATNSLTSLPDSIGQLSSLEHLDLSYNRLTTLPDNLGNLTKLQFLDLDRNKLTSLPKSIKGLSNLKFLDLSRNPLKTLSPEQLITLYSQISQLHNLEELYVYGNELRFFKESIGRLSKREVLYFKNKSPRMGSWEVDKIPESELARINLPTLARVDLQGNFWASMEIDFLAKLLREKK